MNLIDFLVDMRGDLANEYKHMLFYLHSAVVVQGMHRLKLSEYFMLVLLVLVIGFIILSPIFSIWAINTLFSLQVPTNFWTWAAMLWLHIILVVRTKEGE